MSQKNIPAVISELIKRFDQNYQAYHSEPYNETQLPLQQKSVLKPRPYIVVIIYSDTREAI